MKTLLSAAAALAFIAAPTSAATIRTLHSFAGGNSANSWTGLIADASGTLYGTTAPNNGAPGTVFSMSKDGSNFTTIHSFTGVGQSPYSRLVADASGTLYGTTINGGSNVSTDVFGNPSGGGTVFSLSKDGSNFTTLVNFGNGIDTNPTTGPGAAPSGNLLLDASGTIYGTTQFGGLNGGGTVYSRTSNGTLTYLANLGEDYVNQGEDAARIPMGGVIADASGTLYGTSFGGGGAGDLGSVFSLSSSGTLTTLVRYSDNVFINPIGGLIMDASGTLYGTETGSQRVGTSGFDSYGSVFSLTSSGIYTTLVSFDGSNGRNPASGLIADASGTLYGTAGGGAGNTGTVFSLTSSGIFTTLASFAADGSNGAQPDGDLYMDASGKIFGTSIEGGANGFGTVWTLEAGGVPEPASWAMLIAGFGLTGAAMRRRRRVTAVVA